MDKRAWTVVAAMVLGAVVGLWMHWALPPGRAAAGADALSLVVRAFLRLIAMLVAPLVFTSLTVALGRAGGQRGLGRIVADMLVWFVAASLVSLAVGAVLALVLRPGAGLHLAAAPVAGSTGGFDAATFVDDLVPNSFADAMAHNGVLQIVVFSLFAGLAIGRVGERAGQVLRVLEETTAVVFRMVDMVMAFTAPAVFCAIAAVTARTGIALLAGYARMVGGVYLALLVLWAAVLLAGGLVARRSPAGVLRAMRQPLLLAFSTSSSGAAFPRTLEVLNREGIEPEVTNLVLPLSFAFNLQSAMTWGVFAVLFLAQAYDVALDGAQIAFLLFLIFVTSKGLPAVPRAGFVMIAAVLPFFHIPAAGVALLIGVDQILDMGRSATNVLCNYVAVLGVDRLRGAGPRLAVSRGSAS